MIALKRILVPCDFSEFGRLALKYGCELASRFAAELHLLHVTQDLAVIAPEAHVLLGAAGDYLRELEDHARRSLEELARDAVPASVPVVRVVREGKPFVEIVRYAREQDVDLIVVGTHGRTGLVHALMGSVAEQVVRKAACPVLTVRPDEHQFVAP